MSEHKYHVVITFPEEIFPRDDYKSEEGFEGAQVRLLKDWVDTNCLQALVREERGDGGNFHLDCIFGLSKNKRPQNIKRSLYFGFGINAAQQLEMTPSVKKHGIRVKNVNYLPGVMAYNAKEGRTVHIQKGFSDTWIQEQVREGLKNKEVVKARNKIFVNDTTFFRLCREYYEKNDMHGQPLLAVVKSMMKNGYSFVRVRNLKMQLAEWKIDVEGNEENVDRLWGNLEF